MHNNKQTFIIADNATLIEKIKLDFETHNNNTGKDIALRLNVPLHFVYKALTIILKK